MSCYDFLEFLIRHNFSGKRFTMRDIIKTSFFKKLRPSKKLFHGKIKELIKYGHISIFEINVKETLTIFELGYFTK